MHWFGRALHKLQHRLVSIGVNGQNGASMLCTPLLGKHYPSVTHKWTRSLDDGLLKRAGNALGFELVPPLTFDHNFLVVIEARWTRKSHPGKLGTEALPCNMTAN